MLNACEHHLQKYEILEESTVSDRHIIRRLVRSAQQWEWLRSLHRDHIQGLSGLGTLNTEPGWFEGSSQWGGTDVDPEKLFTEILQAVKNVEDIGEGIEYLIRETSSLIQTVSGREKTLDSQPNMAHIQADFELD